MHSKAMKVSIKSASQVDRSEWDAFIQASPQGMFYALSGYMDLIAPDWQAIELRRDGKLQALMPLRVKRKAGIASALQPPFSQFWGVFFAQKEFSSPYKEYSWKGKIVQAVLDQIPKGIRLFDFNFSPAFGLPPSLSLAGL